MVATNRIGEPDDSGELTTLGAPDVDDMLALVDRTKPGPFATRTVELGTYLGYRTTDRRLVAMTGERVHPPGYTELSAVCTDTEARKRGLATAARARGRGRHRGARRDTDSARARGEPFRDTGLRSARLRDPRRVRDAHRASSGVIPATISATAAPGSPPLTSTVMVASAT